MAKTRWLALTAIAWSSFSGCQLVLGDYRIDASEIVPSGRPVCQADEYRCSDALLEVCNSDRSGWILHATCGSPDECNLNSAACRPCRAGEEAQCDGAYLFTCSAEGRWMRGGGTDGNCGTAALCSAEEGRCLPERCSAGKHQCNGAVLERCSAGRDAWEPVTTCASPGLCDPDEADAQAAAREPVTCIVTCDPTTSECGTANCDTPGRLRCDGQTIQLQRCSEAFQWTAVRTCGNLGLCNAAEATCDPAACALTERRCEGNVVYECKSDRTGWDRVRQCGSDELCDPTQARDAECVKGPCLVDSLRCNSIFVERCDGSTWTRVTKCKSRCNTATLKCDPS